MAGVFLYKDHNSASQFMKTSICLAVSLLALNLTPVFGQPTVTPPVPIPVSPAMPPPSGNNFEQRLQAIIQRTNPDQNQPPALTKFNLDFPGGTPAQLVKAIEKAMGKPLNAIIPTEDADLQMPALKMNDVVVPQLFAALEAASRKVVAVPIPGFSSSFQQFTGSYGFKTADGPMSDASIWYFQADKPSMTPKVSTEKICRFFPLSAYLNRGFTVDDITTAIQTGWKMSGESSTPELSYHKETKLLIAFGEPAKLNTIQNALDSLPSSSRTQEHEFDSMNNRISQLQMQVDQMRKQLPIPAPTASAASEEKSGK